MKVETKVGLLLVVTLVFVCIFAYTMGVINPFARAYDLKVMYNYAGGIETGSPVRLMGIVVGKVKSINFEPDQKSSTGEEVKLSIQISVDKKAWAGIRKDSKFYINMAGVIGEKFLEITPGSTSSGEFQPGDHVRGEDPPRVDQLISQGYGLAGKILEIVNKNEGSLTNMISQLDHLVVQFNKTLALLDRTTKNKDMERLLNNIYQISDDLAFLTQSLRGDDSKKTFEILRKLVGRMENLDAAAIKKLLQEEGIKAKLF